MASFFATPALSALASSSIGSKSQRRGENQSHNNLSSPRSSSRPSQQSPLTLEAGTSEDPQSRSHKARTTEDDDQDEEEGGTLLGDRSFSPTRLLDAIADMERRRVSRPLSDEIPPQVSTGRRIADWVLGRKTIVETPSRSEILTDSRRANEAAEDNEEEYEVVDDVLDIGDVRDICPACTTSYDQAVDSIPFRSSLKLSENDAHSHKWCIGNNYILHEAIDDFPEETDIPLVETMRVLMNAPGDPIPAQRVVAGWKEDGKVITISQAIPGKRLYDIWWDRDLSNEIRENLAKEVAGYIQQWRGIQLQWMSNFSGGPVYTHQNLFGTSSGGMGPIQSDEDFWQAIKRRLKKKQIDAEMVQVLREYMPPSAPYVFTHGDLSSRNIYVHNGKVSAIMGFEDAAALPAWAENVAMHFCYCKEDEQWKALLDRHMQRYPAALDWWSLWTAVEDAPNPDTVHLDLLEQRCTRWQKTHSLNDDPEGKEHPDDNNDDDDDDDDDEDRKIELAQSFLRDVMSRRYGYGYDDVRKDIMKGGFPGWTYQDLLSRDPASWQNPVEDEESDDEEIDNNGIRPDLRKETRKAPPRPLPLGNFASNNQKKPWPKSMWDSSAIGDSQSTFKTRNQQEEPEPLPPSKLRPLSLSSYSLFSDDQDLRRKLQKLQATAEDAGSDEEDDEGGGAFDARSREENIAKTLRSLSFVEENEDEKEKGSTTNNVNRPQPLASFSDSWLPNTNAVGGGNGNATAAAAATTSTANKRTSLFGKKVAPGWAYKALTGRAASGTAGAPQDKNAQSQTQTPDAGTGAGAGAGGANRPRPQSIYRFVG